MDNIEVRSSSETTADSPCAPEIQLDAVIAPKISFATHQNDVPVLRDLAITNNGERLLENVRLEIEADPPVFAARSWSLERIAPGATVRPSDRDLSLNAGMLLSLTEAMRADFRLRLRASSGEPIGERGFHAELLAYNEWGGAGAMPELLAAFVQPNDPAISIILRSASEILARAGKPDTIEGYQSGSRSRVYELASAIWSGVVGLQLTYAEPPASFEEQGQKVRSPSQILETGLATCLDTAVLFAACLEQAGLHPILVLTKGHAFTGVWLQPQAFASVLVEEAATLRKRIALDELLVFETTMATSRARPGFAKAIAEGTRRIAEERESEFVLSLDLSRARMQKLRPLALLQEREQVADGQASADADSAAGEPLEAAPALPDFDLAEPEAPPATPEGRLDRWQRKLLDLTVRNRLLHVKPGPSAITLLCPDPAGLEDRLAGGEIFKIVGAPQLEGAAGRDVSIHHARTGEALGEQYAKAALERAELLSPLASEKLEAQLIELYRKVRSDFAEGGANTLFLALGFLNWRKSSSDSRTYRAPLVLLPVKLDRRSARSGIRLSHHEDEARFNLTLLQMLRQDFELEIPELLGGQLPGDESGVDLPGIWNVVRRAVRDTPGFEVSEDVMLGTFSFAKYLMWKDLVDRTDSLKANPVVRHLLETPREPYGNRQEMPRAEALDREIDPADLFAPLPADSSQLSAVVASAKGCDFVLDGPPGTGKSQTIANIIAHNLALGRKVLFVAEKRAALDVVHRRLKAIGLGSFCLELHSNKAVKQEVLSQLDSAWSARGESPAAWAQKAAELKARRDLLNRYVEVLHRRHRNGMTLFAAIGLVVRDGADFPLRFDWPASIEHDEAQMAALREAAHRLTLTWPDGCDPALAAIGRSEWSNQWQSDLITAADGLSASIVNLGKARHALLEGLSVPLLPETLPGMAALADLATAIGGLGGRNFSFAFEPDVVAMLDKVGEALHEIEAYHSEACRLSADYPPEAVRQFDLPDLARQWQAANSAFWPISVFKKATVARALRPTPASKIDPANDLPLLAGLRRRLERLDKLGEVAFRIPQWSGIASDVVAMREALQTVNTLRAACSRAVANSDQLAQLKAALHTLCGENADLLAPDAPVGRAVAIFCAAHRAFCTALERFADLAMGPLPLEADGVLGRLDKLCAVLRRDALQLNRWCAWQRARQAACDLGLEALVAALESGSLMPVQVEAAFETAYARWFATHGIDSEPALLAFNRNEQDDAILRFRHLDEEFTDLTKAYIRARILQEIPPKDARNQPPGFGTLAHQLTLQRRHKPIRQLVTEMGQALTTLSPCLLMSPLSVAQYLPPDAALFDLVIFDEASQITPWDAVGAIARGRQVIVAGDPKQMPPTSFFDRSAGQSSDDGDIEQDMESILDECLGARLAQHRLTWHYRSRHESLIAFSNHTYYGGDLITFPAPVTRENAVSMVPVAGAWARGKTRTNKAEAQAIVGEAVRRLRDLAFRDEKGDPFSLGIITLNSEQQKLIEDLLDVERRRYPELEPFFDEESAREPVIVKNLETVQGDERDVILLGIGFGPETPGAPTMPMNFGPLNRSGGWRRLNVAITRARREMLVYASFPPHLIDKNRTSASAVHDLQNYLEFAECGPRALGERVAGSLGSYESPFEQAVARGLRNKGWMPVTQIGVSRFRIDLGIVHPDRPGDFLAGVECDGATYHSAATARDRDKVRESVLGELGWKLVRVWSTEWWIDPKGALERLDARLKDLLETSRAAIAAREEAAIQAMANAEAETGQSATEPESQRGTFLEATAAHPQQEEVRFAAGSPSLQQPPEERPSSGPENEFPLYRATRFDDLADRLVPDLFQDTSYTGVLREMVQRILEQEGPIRDQLLVDRIARAHGFQRSGRLIRDRVISLARQEGVFRSDAMSCTFIWPQGCDPATWNIARAPADASDLRVLEDIALEELVAALGLCRGNEADAARYFGIRRVSATAHDRLEEARTAKSSS